MFSTKRGLRLCSFILILTLILSMTLTGCGDEFANSEKVDTKVYEAMLNSSFALADTAKNSQVLSDYIEKWARGNDNFKVSHDKHGNVIVSVKALEEYKNAPSTILHCSLETAAPQRTAYAMTTIMYIMEHSQNHGFIRAVFSEPQNGIKQIKKGYLEAESIISLDWSKNNNIMIGSAGRNDYQVHKNIEYQDASYPNAFRITIMGISPTLASKTNQINPIKAVGKLLAELKSTGVLLEIAEFNSGYMNDDGEFVAEANESDGYPTGISTVVMVNDNDVNKLTKKFTKSQTKTLEKYAEDNPNLVYDFIALETPEGQKVISSDDTSKLISFIYTCPFGIYEKDDEGNPVSITNLLSCTTLNGSVDMKLCSMCESEKKLSSLDTVYKTLAGLYELEETKTEIAPIMNMENYQEIPAITRISEISGSVYNEETTYSFGFDNNAAALILQRVPKANIVTYGLSEKNIERQVETILTYLEKSNQFNK